jgi:GntR family transcriptional regulator/MocR family aminotransferase
VTWAYPRGVIVEAYQRLADEGLVSARPGTGTRVLGVWRALFRLRPGPRAARAAAGAAGWRERAEIDLSPGVPDLSGSRGPPGSGPNDWCSSRPA